VLYYIYEFLNINIFQYITVRAIIAFLISFILTLYLIPKFIEWAKNRMTQPIFELAPDTHQKKTNTPTMGGVIFLLSTLISIFLSMKLNIYTSITLLVLFLFAIIGIIDDYSKISNNKNRGLSAKGKFVMQWGFAFLISSILYFSGFNTDLYIPFMKEPIFDMGIGAIVFWAFILVAVSNAVNLTDGLDGLATVPSIFAFLSLTIFIYIMGHYKFSEYLLVLHINGIGEVSIISMALIGALLGFLWFNAHPAQIFMGDSGSLTIGGLIGFLAILAKSEILLIFIGFIFLIETLSVILQVGSFKLRQKRVFAMAPIHHHFELKGWSENKIIVRFWIIALLSNVLAILSLKIR
jgi:phospho-N-acetylmuramoyl-pentapeptide-transferase